jgi:hypothetical protein
MIFLWVLKTWGHLNAMKFQIELICRNPTLGLSVRMQLTLPKVGKWSPSGLSKIQKTIWGVKYPRLGTFFISMERSWSVDAKRVSHWPFGHLQPKLWEKEGSEVKLPVWLPTTKSQESTSSRRRLKECNTALESSQQELQLWFKPRPNPSSGRGTMNVQSPRTPTQDSFRIPTWESREKKPFGCSLSGEL